MIQPSCSTASAGEVEGHQRFVAGEVDAVDLGVDPQLPGTGTQWHDSAAAPEVDHEAEHLFVALGGRVDLHVADHGRVAAAGEQLDDGAGEGVADGDDP
ncbi:hypothetical protein [Saccharothrix syringae]|uniref:Uncharacterized protein n=1 Tax=Saccharothrix syringae TaxID=103733 RepID=A0A5Q0H372_SACSY|nr:hypothetical protein [Saccharothrix syringae]QFZ20365.1 hypothetical protein EKG83_25730 [Saccharothrix syringae]